MTTQPKWRLLYEKIAPVLVVFCLLASLFATVGTYWGARVNAAQDRARTTDNTRLLGCFNQYAKASSESSTAVRVASVRKDAATTERDNTLNEEGRAFLRVVDHLLADSVTPQDVQNLRDSLRLRAVAAAKLDRAQAALDTAREDNPVPPPPSTFCSAR